MEGDVDSTNELMSKDRDSHESQPSDADLANYLGGTVQSGNSSIAKLKRECDSISLMVAMSFRGLSCNIHERCDGNCGSGSTYQENPLLDTEGLVLSPLLGVVNVNPTKATPQDVPHDAQWLEQQEVQRLVYSPINGLEGEIRLLRVREALFRADIVECDLITTSLDQCEDFIALSYCWGSDKQNEPMLCNGRIHYISTSLNAALKVSRESAKTRGRLLWSDAVSIDQSNESEKSEQIPLMRRIYSEADACLVYLGEERHLVPQGLELLLRLSLLQNHLKTPKKRGPVPRKALLTLLPSREHTCWTEYLRVFTSPWFSRTWTLQEIILSKKAMLGIARYVMDWDLMEDSFRFLKRHFLLFRIGPRPKGAMTHVANFSKLQVIRKISESPDPSCALIAILRATRHFKVTDPRDKIFGVLGLIGDLPDELKTLVDYKLSVGEVFHKAALYMYDHPNPVHLLAHAGLQRQSDQWDMPSWVPDWYLSNAERNYLPLWLDRPEAFMAGGHELASCMWRGTASSPPREVITLGLCHHRITHVSDPLAYKNWSIEACYTWLNSARQCINSTECRIYEDVEEAFARTLLFNKLETPRNASFQMAAIEEPKKISGAAFALIDEARGSKNLEDTIEQCYMNAKNGSVEAFIIRIDLAARGRRFAMTDTGYMCLVPACAEIGDAVAIFAGHPTPFTIRLEPGSEMGKSGLKHVHARLVGDTYVHGVMDGEMWAKELETWSRLCEIGLI